ncbi:MAG: sulfate adenylyltransferase subunit CysN [Acidobacteria bacterium]|nr:sulfate adenylyltransferase subunit CysN [Acidobacteriota bacterium]
MSHQSELIGTDIHAYLAQHERKQLLRLLTCGSVDDGKSTLIGRLLHDSKIIYEDQLAAVTKDSARFGTVGAEVDLALLVDGLQAEREQGITIDVAYRYFSTSKRKFIIADTPGHEQYTRNMATGASTCSLAIILVDARNGVATQTRRHSFIVSLLGIRHIIVAINKMDLVGYSEAAFNQIRQSYVEFLSNLEQATGHKHDVHFMPISALKGDNVVYASQSMPWWLNGESRGEPLMSLLENIKITNDENYEDVRFPVQWVNRPNLDFRGFSGTMAAGVLRRGDPVLALPSHKRSRVKSIVTFDGDIEEAFPPQAVTVTLEDEIDVSRGDMLVRPDNLPMTGTHLRAHIVWMNESPLVPGKQYYIKQNTKTVNGSVARIHYRIDVNTLEHVHVEQLKLNGIALCEVGLSAPLAFDPYTRSRGTGSFIIIDRLTNATVGAGMILGLADDGGQGGMARNVTSEERAARFAQKPATIWMTGTNARELAYQVERRLFDAGHAASVIDAESYGESAALIANSLNQAGLICLAIVEKPTIALDATHHSLNVEGMSVETLQDWLKRKSVI